MLRRIIKATKIGAGIKWEIASNVNVLQPKEVMISEYGGILCIGSFARYVGLVDVIGIFMAFAPIFGGLCVIAPRFVRLFVAPSQINIQVRSNHVSKACACTLPAHNLH